MLGTLTSGGPDLRDCMAQASICISRSVKTGAGSAAPVSLPESDMASVGGVLSRRGRGVQEVVEEGEDVVDKNEKESKMRDRRFK